MIFSFKCGQQYFLGAQHLIHIHTDHKNLQYFKEPQKIMGCQSRWMEFLQDFDYHIEHIPGTMNTIADLLSHRKDLNKGVDSDSPRILLPDTLFLRKTFQYVKGCAKYQESKMNLPWRKAPLQRFDVPAGEGPFQYVSMDLITDLPRSEGFDSILTIVNQGCSKAAKFIPCNKMIDGPGMAQEYLRHLVPWFGIPKCIISNRNPWFASHFCKAFCKALGIQQNLSTVFHPRTDGQMEWMNAWIEQYLRPWTTGWQNNWAKLLLIAEFAHNSWKNDTTHHSPHELLIGTRPQVNIQLIDGNTPAANVRLKELKEARQEVQRNLEAQQLWKDEGRMTEMKTGDKVWLEGKNLHIIGTHKLLPKRYGPFTIMEQIGPVAYRLELPPSMKIHNVFHIDLLMPYKEMEQYGMPYTWPPPVIDQGEEEYEIKLIISDRRFGRNWKKQYLIHWKGYPSSKDSWVNHEDLHAPEILQEYLVHSARAGWTNV